MPNDIISPCNLYFVLCTHKDDIDFACIIIWSLRVSVKRTLKYFSKIGLGKWIAKELVVAKLIAWESKRLEC